MNNKGFTVVELITTFAVASAIALILFNIVLIIKNFYSTSNIKTNLLINQANLSEQFNSITLHDDISSIDFCNDEVICYEFVYTDGNKYKLTINNNIIKFGNYTYKLEKGSHIDENNIVVRREKIDSVSVGEKNAILNVRIPILSDQYPGKDFGLNYVYLHDYNYLEFNIQ